MSRKSKLDVTTSYDDWIAIRECFVKSFYRYPLYEYMVPDKSKREAFLRAYLEANYEVTVGSGQGILFGMWVFDDNINSSNNCRCQTATAKKIIGGILIIPPSAKGSGWSCDNDEPYWKAYDAHNLSEISEQGFQRVLRYEAWENSMVAQKASQTRIPMWNGLFCAVLPEYASMGLGSAVYQRGIEFLCQQSRELQKKAKASMKRSKTPNVMSLQADVVRFPQESNENLFGSNKIKIKDIKNNEKVTKQLLVPSPIVVAISHSKKSSHFYEYNGFESVLETLFHDDEEDETPFNVHVLALDLFGSKSTKAFRSVFEID